MSDSIDLDSKPTKTTERSALPFIFVTVLLDVLSFGIIIPVLPNLLKQMVGGDAAIAASYYGLFGTTWAVAQFFCAPILGSLSDRFGRRPVLLLSCLGLGLDYILMALAPTWQWLWLGRLLSGITAASFATAGAYVADVTPPEKRAASYGIFGAAFGLGFILGPAVGGILGSVHLRLPFWVSAALALANAAYGFWILPESLPPEKRRSFSWSRANPIGTWKFLFSIPSLSRLALVGFLYQLAHQVLHNVFVLYTQHRYDWKEREVGLALAAVGVGSVVVQGFLVRRMMARFNEPMLLLTALSFGVAGMLLFGIAPNASWFCLAIPVMAGLGFFMPALQGMMTRQVEAQQQGQLQGATGALQSVAGLIGPMLFTSLFAAVLKREAAPFWTGIPFWVAGLLLLLAIFIAIPAARSYRDS